MHLPKVTFCLMSPANTPQATVVNTITDCCVASRKYSCRHLGNMTIQLGRVLHLRTRYTNEWLCLHIPVTKARYTCNMGEEEFLVLPVNSKMSHLGMKVKMSLVEVGLISSKGQTCRFTSPLTSERV